MRHALLLAGAIVVAGCSHATAPRFVVAISGPATEQAFDTTENGVDYKMCESSLNATATGGSSHEEATWGSLAFKYVRADGVEYSGSEPTAAAFFGGNETIESGSSETGFVTGSWTQSFTLYLTFYYSTPQTSRDSATFSFACQVT